MILSIEWNFANVKALCRQVTLESQIFPIRQYNTEKNNILLILCFKKMHWRDDAALLSIYFYISSRFLKHKAKEFIFDSPLSANKPFDVWDGQTQKLFQLLKFPFSHKFIQLEEKVFCLQKIYKEAFGTISIARLQIMNMNS